MAARAQWSIAWRSWRMLVLAAAAPVGLLILACDPGLFRPRPPELVVNAIAHQWWWAFEYPSLGIVSRDDLHIPDDRPVRLILSSADVIHSFIVPPMKNPIDVVPGMPLTLTLVSKSRGTLYGSCKSSCGTGDKCMQFKVAVIAPNEFSNWVERQRTASAPVAAPRDDSKGSPNAEADRVSAAARHLAQLLDDDGD